MLNEVETKVSELLRKGMSDKEMCLELKLRYKEIRLALKNLYKEYDVKTRYQLIVKLFKST